MKKEIEKLLFKKVNEYKKHKEKNIVNELLLDLASTILKKDKNSSKENKLKKGKKIKR